VELYAFHLEWSGDHQIFNEASRMGPCGKQLIVFLVERYHFALGIGQPAPDADVLWHKFNCHHRLPLVLRQATGLFSA
jgi:hypothetical protein